MYSPDHADIDPANPANWKDLEYRYEVRAKGKFIQDFNDKDFAVAFILNNEFYFGPELDVFEIDAEYGDEECVMCAEYDEDLQRYLKD